MTMTAERVVDVPQPRSNRFSPDHPDAYEALQQDFAAVDIPYSKDILVENLDYIKEFVGFRPRVHKRTPSSDETLLEKIKRAAPTGQPLIEKGLRNLMAVIEEGAGIVLSFSNKTNLHTTLKTGRLNQYRTSEAEAGSATYKIPRERITALGALPMAGIYTDRENFEQFHVFHPVLDLRIQSDHDEPIRLRRPGGDVLEKHPGHWHRLPLEVVDLSLLDASVQGLPLNTTAAPQLDQLEQVAS